MKRTSIPLSPVYITGRFASPQSQLEANKRLYNKAYGSLADHDLLSVNSNGAGLSIDGFITWLAGKAETLPGYAKPLTVIITKMLLTNALTAHWLARLQGLKIRSLPILCSNTARVITLW